MATQAHAPATGGLRRYRRVIRLPITGANVSGKVSLCDGDKDMVILGTIAAFGPLGLPSLTTNFGPINTVAAWGNAVGPPTSTTTTGSTVNGTTGPTSSTASIPLTMNGAVTGYTPPTVSTVSGVTAGPTSSTASAPLIMNWGVTGHTPATLSTVNGVIAGPTSPIASIPLTMNGAVTGHAPPTSSIFSTINGVTPTTSAAPAANGITNTTTLTFAPLTSLAGSDHGLPYELTDLLVSFKECKGIFKCIRDLQANTFSQLAIVSLNSHLREALNISPTTTVTYPIAHMAGTLMFDRNDENLMLTISWIINHAVEFKIEASTSQQPLWW